MARNALTAVSAQERARTIPRLHRASTVAWGLVRWGKWVWIVVVHSVTRGWQDIRFLLGCMGYMATHTTSDGTRILPLCIEGRNIIGSKTYPRKHDQSPLIEEQTEFPADNPAVIREAFPANLLRATAFADGVNELDAIRVDDSEHGRRRQEGLRPVLMGLEEAKEPGALGKLGKQRPIVARQPPIEGAVADAFERVQQSQGDDLAGPEVGLGGCGDGAQLLIDLIKQGGDKIHRAHAALLCWEGCHRDQHGGGGCRLQTQKCALVVFTVLYASSSL